MEDDLKKIYDAVSPKLDVGDYDAFATKMQTPEQRKSFYDVVAKNGFDLGDYDSYETRLKKKGEVSGEDSKASSTPQSPSPSIEDEFSFLKSDDTPPPMEASTTRVEPPVMDKNIVQTSEIAQRYGILPSETEFELPVEGDKSSQTDTQKQAAKANPELAQAMQGIRHNVPMLEQAGKDLRTALTTPKEPHPFVKVAEGSEFGRTAVGFLKGVNEGVAGTLHSLDGAERAFYDALGMDRQDGWFGKAANYMDESLQGNWPEEAKNTIAGKLVYDLGHMVPFFGELLVTPKIGKVGQLENLLTTKGFTTAYGDADARKELGLEAKPLAEGLYGGAMGLKDALTFHLLGYGSGKAGEVVQKATGMGDAAVAANMISNGLGFSAYGALDEYIQTGEVNWADRPSEFFMGVGLASPGMMQQLGNRVMNNYYGMSEVSLAKVRQLPQSVIQLRDMAFSIREQAGKATSVREQMKLLAQAKAWDTAADMKAGELIVVRDPEGTVKAIKENESLTDVQKEAMIKRVQSSTLNAEVDAMKAEKAAQEGKEGVSPEKGTEAPLEGEKPSEPPKTKIEEVKEKSAEYDNRTLELLNEFEQAGESSNYAEAVANIDVKIAELSKEGKHTEAEKLQVLLEEVDNNKYFKRQGDVKLETTQAIKDEIESKQELKTEQDGLQEQTKAEETETKAEEVKKPKETVEKGMDVEGDGKEIAATIDEGFSLSTDPSNIPKSKLDKPEPRKEKPASKKTVVEELSDRIAAREAALTAGNKSAKQTAIDVFLEQLVDVNEPFKRALLKEGAGAAQDFINRMNTERGATAFAKDQIHEAQKKVFGKGFRTMSQKKQKFMSEIADLIRTAELDDLKGARREEMIKEMIKTETEDKGRPLTKEETANLEKNIRNEVEEQYADLLHEGGVTGEKAKELIEKFRNKELDAEQLFGVKDYDPAKIEASIAEYHKVMQEQLRQLHEAGIVGDAAYTKLKAEQPFYSPRKYISKMEEIDSQGSLSGIAALKGGSKGEKVIDMNTLLSDVVSRTANIIARNKKMQEASSYAEVIDSGIVKNAPISESFRRKLEAKKEGAPYEEPQFRETPKDMVELDFLQDGLKKRIWIDRELYKNFDYAPKPEATEQALHAVGMAMGTPILKYFATGANPEFAVKNLLIDALHVWMTTPEYSPIMPIGMGQLALDMCKVANDAWTKKGRWRDYIKEGGGMDFLTTQGNDMATKFNKRTVGTSYARGFRDGTAKIGEFSESLTRLALRERYIKNRLDQAKAEGRELNDKEKAQLQYDGTAFSRNYLDFSQGGNTAKMADTLIPYLNAGIQVTRGSLRAAAKNPKLFGAKITQIAALATTLTAWNMGDWGEEEMSEERRGAYLNDISPQVKARNFIIMTNMKYTDGANNTRHLYFKIPKDGLQSSITSLAEDGYIKAVHDGQYKLMNDKMMTSMQNEFRNITDFTNLPPLVRASMGYKQNYDSFYETEIWSGREQPDEDASAEIYEGVTPARYIKFGQLTNMSPVRTQYFAKQFFTEGNLYGSILGEFLDGVMGGGFDSELGKFMQKEGAQKMKAIPGLRRILKSTYPKSPEAAEKAQKELNRVQTINDSFFNQLVRSAETPADIDMESFNIMLEEMLKEDGPYEVARIMRKYEDMLATEGVTSSVRKLYWFAPEVRAVGFYQLIKNAPTQEAELWKQAEQAGLTSDRFRAEVGRLRDQEVTKPVKKAKPATKEAVKKPKGKGPTSQVVTPKDKEKSGNLQEVKTVDVKAKPEYEKMAYIPMKALKGKKVKMDVEIEETGEKVKATIGALQVHRDIKKRQAILDELLTLIG